MSDKTKHLNAPNAQDAQAKPAGQAAPDSLPFGGKFAAVLLLLVAAAAVVLAVVKAYRSCDLARNIPPWNCVWSESTGLLRDMEVYTFAAGGVVLLWLALSVAVFVWRWADGLLFGGKWAIVSLAAIIVGESVITEFWQGYVNSFGKVTDKLVWVLLLWFVVAWRGKSVMDWVTRSLQEAAEKPVKAVKESVDGAAQTMKTAADDITKGLHKTAEATADAAKKTIEGAAQTMKTAADDITKGLHETAEATTEAAKKTAESITNSVADISEKTAASVAKGVTGAYATMGEHANTAVEVVSDTAGVATDKLKSVVGIGGDKSADSEDDKQAAEDAPETSAKKEGEGSWRRMLPDWLPGSGKDEEEEEMPSVGKSPLHEAAESGDADTVKRLLDEKGNPNQTNDAGQSALHLAAKAGHAGVVDVLIGKGADVAARDKDGNTAEDVAKKERGKDDAIAARLSKAAKG